VANNNAMLYCTCILQAVPPVHWEKSDTTRKLKSQHFILHATDLLANAQGRLVCKRGDSKNECTNAFSARVIATYVHNHCKQSSRDMEKQHYNVQRYYEWLKLASHNVHATTREYHTSYANTHSSKHARYTSAENPALVIIIIIVIGVQENKKENHGRHFGQ
jgi:hypothetical protein